MRIRSALPVIAAALALAACVGKPAELSDRQVCLEHHKDNPAERDRCLLNAENRRGAPPQARPQDLPVRTNEGQGF